MQETLRGSRIDQVRVEMRKLLDEAEAVVAETPAPGFFNWPRSRRDDQQLQRLDRIISDYDTLAGELARLYRTEPEVDLIEVTTFGDTERRYIAGIGARKCAYCKTTQPKIANCKNCGAPL